jgi:hypothetical protein
MRDSTAALHRIGERLLRHLIEEARRERQQQPTPPPQRPNA